MFRKFFSSQIHSVASAAIVIGGASLLSKIFGVLRDRVLASHFGAGEILDTYYAAFRIPDLVYQLLIAGTLSAGFIPLFLSYREKSKKEANQFANTILFFVTFFLTAISCLGIFFASKIIPFIVPGFGGEMLSATITMTRIMFLSSIFLGISSILASILQSQKHFFTVAIAPIFYNIGIIVGAVYFVPYWGVYGLAYGVVLGAFSHFLIQVPALFFSEFRFEFPGFFMFEGIKNFFRLVLPRIFTLGVTQINFLVITNIASTLGVGNLSVFNWAYNLQSFPLGIFALSFAIAAFPTLSELSAKKDYTGFVKEFSMAIRQILFFLVPSTFLLIILRAQIVRVILGAGVFDWTATVLTMNTLAYLSIGLVSQGIIFLLARVFYALQETRIPFYVAFFAMFINIPLAYSFSERFGIEGLGFAFSIVNIFQCILLWFFLRSRLPSLDERRIFLSFLKLSLTTIVLILVTQYTKTFLGEWIGTDTFIKIFIQGGVSLFSGVASFIIAGYFIGQEELAVFLSSFQRRFLRLRHPVDIEEL